MLGPHGFTEIILSRCDGKPTHIINLAVKFLNEVRYYNIASRLFGLDCNAGTCRNPTKRSR